MRPAIPLLLAPLLGGIALALTATHAAPQPTGVPAASASRASTGLEAGEFEIDPVHSAVLFRVKHMDVAYFYGRFNRFSGTITLDDDAAKCSVRIEFDTGSVDTANEGRDKHLRSPDFLDAVQFPTATFTSTSLKVADAKDKTYTVTGDLELHGEKKEVTLEVALTGAKQTRRGYKAGFEGSIVFDRQDFGISYGAGMLGDEVTLMFGFEATRK